MRGRPRKVTDEMLRRLRAWKSLTDLARELGITPKLASHARHRAYRPRREA